MDFAIASVILLGMMVYYRFVPGWSILCWPLLLIPLVMLTLGVGMMFAALNVKYRDVQHVLPFVVQLWLFVTPIIYPMNMIPERWRPVLAINPLTGIIEAFRACVVPSQQVDLHLLGISLVVTVILFVASAAYFRRTARSFADII